MRGTPDLVSRLTSGQLSTYERRRSLKDFAHTLGWTPSEQMEFLHLEDFSTAHLVVEHGLENAAVITFLSQPFAGLSQFQRRSIVGLSYNNLVDWHICIDVNDATFLYNRAVPPKTRVVSSDELEKLRRDAFDQVVGRRPNPNIPALDDALIKTISYWKRALAAELGSEVPNGQFASLFNGIIFCRALEDYHRRHHGIRDGSLQETEQYLTDQYLASEIHNVGEFLQQSAQMLLGEEVPAYLLSLDTLASFNGLTEETVYALLGDFYNNRFAAYYRYDFAVISKHALSRIYERYVSVLRPEEDGEQTSFLPAIPGEDLDRTTGNVYTPEFIAKFFGRVVRDTTPPRAFRRLQSIDPACGSGIFLRTLLEMQCDPASFTGATDEDIEAAFSGAWGIDLDANAAQAARLSLALLHLLLTGGRLPPHLNVHNAEAVRHFLDGGVASESFDVVVANPPFVAVERQSQDIRDAIDQLLGHLKSGRTDTYLAFLYLGFQLLREGGTGLFVLPHSFLLADSARPLRLLLSQEAELQYIVDLSQAEVFEEVSAYVVLLVIRKNSRRSEPGNETIIVRAKTDVGSALQAALNRQPTSTPYYSVHIREAQQFSEEPWILRPPAEEGLLSDLAEYPTIAEFLDVKQGYVSGADSVFLRSRSDILEGETRIYVPLVPDREIGRYDVLDGSDMVAFYPYPNGTLVGEPQIRSDFPETWAYLNRHKDELQGRSQVEKGNLPWWKPERPRPPRNLLRPKLVSPHLVLSPRFGIDLEGVVAVTRSPMLMAKRSVLKTVPIPEQDLLKYFLAVFNSSVCFWYVTAHSHSYDRGYSLLEPKTLVSTPVPDPAQLRPTELKKIIGLVNRRLAERGPSGSALEDEIDWTVADLYSLSASDRELLGIARHG